MQIFNLEDFPFVEFGENPTRKIRLLASPETTGEQRCDIVVCTVPGGGISEGHTHPVSDEYIYFDIGGAVRLGGQEYPVKEKSVIHAKKGVLHECVNTSPDKVLTLVCFFVPAFAPYGKYPELIERTKEYIEGQEKEQSKG